MFCTFWLTLLARSFINKIQKAVKSVTLSRQAISGYANNIDGKYQRKISLSQSSTVNGPNHRVVLKRRCPLMSSHIE